MSDLLEKHGKRAELVRPLRVRWPDLFDKISVQGSDGYYVPQDALTHIADKARDVDERIIDAYVRIRIGSDTPCRVRPSTWHKLFGLRPVPKVIEDLLALQRRFAAMSLLTATKEDDPAIIVTIVSALEQQPG